MQQKCVQTVGCRLWIVTAELLRLVEAKVAYGFRKDGQETQGSCNVSGVFLWEVGFCYGSRENICEHLT